MERLALRGRRHGPPPCRQGAPGAGRARGGGENFRLTEKPFAIAVRRADVSFMSDPCKTSSPASPPASAGARSSAKPKETLFNTITSDDWKRSLSSARRQKNAVSAQIQTAISSSSKKTK